MAEVILPQQTTKYNVENVDGVRKLYKDKIDTFNTQILAAKPEDVKKFTDTVKVWINTLKPEEVYPFFDACRNSLKIIKDDRKKKAIMWLLVELTKAYKSTDLNGISEEKLRLRNDISDNSPSLWDQEQLDEVAEKVRKQREHVINHLKLHSEWTDDIFAREWYSWIYKFSDNSADLIYISSESEKEVKQRGDIFGMYPNQIYKFDENHKDNDGVFEDKDKETWTFINGKPAKKWEDANVENTFSWLAKMNSEDMYAELKDEDWKTVSKYKYEKQDWEKIKENWKKEEKQREEAKKKKEEEQKQLEAKNIEETKQLKNILDEYGLLDDIQDIVKMQNAISEVDESWEIDKLKKENEKIKTEYSDLQKDLSAKQKALQTANWNSVAEKPLNKDISELQKKLDEKAKKYNENEQKIAELKAINKQENLELWDRITERKDFKEWEYWNRKEWRQYKDSELLSEKQQNLVKKLENKIKEITEASEIPEISKQDREKFKQQLPLLTQVLESQKVLLNLGKDDSDYTRNEADQIVKNWESGDVIYTMDTYGRLVKNEKEKKELVVFKWKSTEKG